jgi:hypothetical protein
VAPARPQPEKLARAALLPLLPPPLLPLLPPPLPLPLLLLLLLLLLQPPCAPLQGPPRVRAAAPPAHRLSMASTKQVVLPLPLWAWAMRSRYTPAWSGCRIMGSVVAWMRLGWSNFISE